MHVFSNATPGSCQRPTFKHIPINLGQVIWLPSHGTALLHDLCTQDILSINCCQTMDSTECITNIQSRPTVLLNVGCCQGTPLCRTQIWRRRAPHFTPSVVPVGEQPTTCPAQKVFLRHLYSILPSNAHAMSLPSPTFFHATSMHHNLLFHSVFAGTRTLAFRPRPRKQAFVVFRGLCILLSTNVLACSSLISEARRNK
jgi:hypothetical protein